MFGNYLTIAFRAISRNKVHSAINILGLSLGIASCILIVLFVFDEWTFDRFHSKADRIYRVFARENWGENQEFFYTTTPFPMGPTLKENIPEVEDYTRVVVFGSQARVEQDQFSETITVADRAIFSMFDFPLREGAKETCLDNPGKLVISRSASEKYFGDSPAIGRTMLIQMGDKFEDFVISAIADVPTNSSIQFTLLISDENLPRLFGKQALTSAWFSINPETYVLLREGVDASDVTAKFPQLFKTVLGEERYKESNYAPGLQPLLDIHLGTDYPAGIAPVSNPVYAYILAAVAILILAIACINFVTLSIGKSLKRAREVGIRKVVGAVRRQLITQFIGEAILVTFISMVIGIGLAVANLSLFNELSGKSLMFPFNGFMALVIASLLLLIGLVAGSYPAFVLSAFRPVTVLKGTASGINHKQSLRKILVGVQLALSIFLISSTLIMRNQLTFLQNKNLGFNKEQVAVVQLNVPRVGSLPERVRKGFEVAEQFKIELAKLPDVISACGSSHDFANGAWVNVGFTDEQGTYRTFNLNVIDDDYVPTLQIDIVSGRNFSDELPADKRRSVIVNEAFARLFGWDDPIGKRIPGARFPDNEVVGVVHDFNYSSLYSGVAPLALVEDPAVILPGIENINITNSPIPKLLIRFRPGNLANAVEQVKGIWNTITGGEEFSLSFVDQALAFQYRADQNLGKIIGIATVLAMVIGAMGLYGLASLTMQNRVREVSIRKVLGATERSLLVLLSREYVVMVVVALLISVPVTWYFMNDWLLTFEYRVPIRSFDFLIAGLVALAVAIITISYHTLKTTGSQPARTLKYE